MITSNVFTVALGDFGDKMDTKNLEEKFDLRKYRQRLKDGLEPNLFTRDWKKWIPLYGMWHFYSSMMRADFEDSEKYVSGMRTRGLEFIFFAVYQTVPSVVAIGTICHGLDKLLK